MTRQENLKSRRKTFRYLWALPTTSLGLVAALLALASGAQASVVKGVLEVHGGLAAVLLKRFPISGGCRALTLGHVVLGTDRESLAVTRRHERVHVRQCEAWGPFFLPAYLVASAWALIRGRDPYRGNWFEARAFSEAEPDCRGSGTTEDDRVT